MRNRAFILMGLAAGLACQAAAAGATESLGPSPSPSPAPPGQPVRREGVLETWVADRLDGGTTLTHRLRSPQTLESWELRFEAPPPEPTLPGDQLTVTGLETERSIAVAAYQIHRPPVVQRKSASTAGVPSPAAPGDVPRKTAVILAETRDHPSRPYTPAQLQDLVFSATDGVSAILFENSYHHTWLEGPVSGWHTLPLSVGSTCPAGQLFDEALVAAHPDLGNYSRYDHVIVILSGMPNSNCNFGGLAGRGKASWVMALLQPGQETWSDQAWARQTTQDIIVHELGHAGVGGGRGVPHANRWKCAGQPAASSVLAPCEEIEGVDHQSPMGGGGSVHFNAPEKQVLGNWFSPENVVDVETSGRYTIAPLERPSRGIQALRIPKELFYSSDRQAPDRIWYILEYRQPIGLDARLASAAPASLFQGALFHLNFTNYLHPPTPTDGSLLLDMSPTDLPLEKDQDLTLGVHQTFVDPSGISITPVSATPQGLEVEVRLPPASAPDTLAPSARFVGLQDTTLLGAALTGKAMMPLTLEAADNRGIVEARFYDDTGALIGRDTVPPFSVEWNAAGTLNRARRSFEARVLDAAGNEGVARASSLVVIDRVRPTARLLSPDAGSTLSGRTDITVEAQDENGIQSVAWWVNRQLMGVQYGTSPAASIFRFSWDTTAWPNGAYTIYATVWDNALNPSDTPSRVVRVRNAVPPQPPFLTYRRQGDVLVLTWPGPGTLQAADDVTGPWRNVPGAYSPFSVALVDAKKFYRLAPFP